MILQVVKLLGSLRSSLVLILSLSTIFLLGLWIPQKGVIQYDLYLQWKTKAPAVVSVLDALGLTNIYTSPITLALWALFFLNLSLVMWRRVPVVRTMIMLPQGMPPDPISTSAYPQTAAFPFPFPDRFDAVREVLSGAGYRFIGASEGFSAVKNRFSPVATLLFHFSFMLILLGGVVSIYTRFSGIVDLAEGETFRGEIEQYHPVPRTPKIGSGPLARFSVEKIAPEIVQGVPTGIKVTLRDENGAMRIAEINRPYRVDNTSFVIRSLGIAPLVIMRDKKGNELDGAYVKLDVMNGKQDAFKMMGLDFAVEFFPDYFTENGREGTRSSEIRNPFLRFHIQKNRTFLARPLLGPGGSASVAGYTMELREMPLWARFYVVKERGLWIIYTGFACAAGALIWRLIFYRREIVGWIAREGEGTFLHLAGRAEFYRTLFEDEFIALVERLSHQGGEDKRI